MTTAPNPNSAKTTTTKMTEAPSLRTTKTPSAKLAKANLNVPRGEPKPPMGPAAMIPAHAAAGKNSKNIAETGKVSTD